MKRVIILMFLAFSFTTFGQNEILRECQIADFYINGGLNIEAYEIYKVIEPKIDKKDSLYAYVLWYSNMLLSDIEGEYRMEEDWNNSLKYQLEALKQLEKTNAFFNNKLKDNVYWMQKNIIVSYFGLGDMKNAEKHKKILYKAYKKKQLPEGIDEYFNFSFFRWEDKNIWGYEWFPELGDKETEGSFTKVVYYVYSKNPDGTDKKQLCRYHVLKFHKFNSGPPKFDYILEKQTDEEQGLVSGSYYKYTYNKKIDYKKLKNDIIEILEKNIVADTKRIMTVNR